LRCPATDRSWALDAVVAPWQYLEPISKLVLQLKFQNRFSIGRAFGLLLGEKLRPRRQRIDFLVPVPLHRQRLRTRSFNQADEIATVLGRTLGLPLFRHAVRRIHSTVTQTTLTLRQRLKNVEHAFQVDARFDGLRLALVDDVITSGATINALARACRAAGATRIEAWAVARTTATDCDSTADATVTCR
jgi:ComF family protein